MTADARDVIWHNNGLVLTAMRCANKRLCSCESETWYSSSQFSFLSKTHERHQNYARQLFRRTSENLES